MSTSQHNQRKGDPRVKGVMLLDEMSGYGPLPANTDAPRTLHTNTIARGIYAPTQPQRYSQPFQQNMRPMCQPVVQHIAVSPTTPLMGSPQPSYIKGDHSDNSHLLHAPPPPPPVYSPVYGPYDELLTVPINY